MISLGGQAPHVLRAHMGVHRTCREPNEIELTAAHGLRYRPLFQAKFNGRPMPFDRFVIRKYVNLLLGTGSQGSFRPGFLQVAHDLLLGTGLQGSFRPGFYRWLAICCWVLRCRAASGLGFTCGSRSVAGF